MCAHVFGTRKYYSKKKEKTSTNTCVHERATGSFESFSTVGEESEI